MRFNQITWGCEVKIAVITTFMERCTDHSSRTSASLSVELSYEFWSSNSGLRKSEWLKKVVFSAPLIKIEQSLYSLNRPFLKRRYLLRRLPFGFAGKIIMSPQVTKNAVGHLWLQSLCHHTRTCHQCRSYGVICYFYENGEPLVPAVHPPLGEPFKNIELRASHVAS